MSGTALGIGNAICFGATVLPFRLSQLAPDQLLDADETDSFTLNGTKVAQWGDLSAGGTFDAAQAADGNRPILSAAPDVVSFTRATPHYLTMPVLATPAAWYALMVGTIAEQAAIQQVFRLDYGAGGSGVQLATSAANGLTLSQVGVTSITKASGAWSTALCRREMGWDGAKLRYRENGGAWSEANCASISYSGAELSSIGAYFNSVQAAEMTMRLWLLMARWPSVGELNNIGALSVARFGV